ncbi:MAG: RluA family pseudouridine synthase [Acidobacteriota bacterium]
MSQTSKILIDELDAGKRLDSFLSEHIQEISRSTAQKWISSGDVQVNRAPRKSSYTLQDGDLVSIKAPEPAPLELIPEKMDLDILYEDDDLLAVHKPAGLIVHPGAGNPSGTLANGLLYYLREASRSDTLRPGIVHRLDKDTSGVLVVAKNDYIHDCLSSQFRERKVKKIYIALVFGQVEPESGEIDIPIGRDKKSRTRISPRSVKPRDALTLYRVLEYFSAFTLLKAYPKTGRTHQIRVHFQTKGHPIVGDETYGFATFLNRISNTRHRKAVKDMNRLFLHSASLSVHHPRTDKPLTFTAPLPEELVKLTDFLRE